MPATIVLTLSLLLWPCVVEPAAAQSGGRILVGLSGGVQSGAPPLTDHFEFERNVETATVDVKYPAKSAVLVDGSLTARVWKEIGAGVAVSQGTRSGSALVDARIPHPLLFQQPRTVAGSQSALDTAETGVHIYLAYAVRATRRLTVTPFGGPSFLHLARELVRDVTYNESYPYDAATFSSAPTRRATAGAIGVNAGVDLRWMFARSVGIGGLVRFTRATIDLSAGDRSLPVRAGGIQAGAGIRLVF